ncbi:uncharacterized protein METZ01_LOCUS346434, partial [marine metagenome]
RQHSSKKNDRMFLLDNIVGFFYANMNTIKAMEKDNVLPVTDGVGLSRIAEDLITGYNTDRIIDLDEMPTAGELNNGDNR